ncbi:MAG: SPFH domain-containing protein [Propionibacteriaceae bacterium]|jgi:regulator of protease activity HflC (stomatin/prohibitin superfamily)|nr:SPFH domain-containing protein [Propionibacteriaceae bacterium]
MSTQSIPASGQPRSEIVETPAAVRPAWVGLLAIVGLTALCIVSFCLAGLAVPEDGDPGLGFALWLVGGFLALGLATVAGTGLTVVQPGTTKVLTFFGHYIGTVRQTGLFTVRPLTGHAKLSVRVRNFETGELKVNDADGNPVNIAAIVVWEVSDTARASFAVDNYRSFVQTQAESALRHVATAHPYDGADGAVTLRGSTAQVSDELAAELAERIEVAGVAIREVRISKLAYAPEIAQAMLQRQQAGAIIAARERIVEGAVSMVREALARLEAEGVVTLDDERRAAMVSNLLVVLTGDSRATPVINTGSLYV